LGGAIYLEMTKTKYLAGHDLEFGFELHASLSPLQNSMELLLIDIDGILSARHEGILLAGLQKRAHLRQLERSKALLWNGISAN
jgi:hypothetical protein